MFQQSLFKPVSIPSKEHLRKFQVLLSHLPYIEQNEPTGRPATYSKFSLLSALIYKNLRCIPNFYDLIKEINDYRELSSLLNIKCKINKERVSVFLKNTPNTYFKTIFQLLIRELLSLGAISFDYLSTDSCPVFSPIKENNTNTNVPLRFDKSRTPKGDPDATLCHYVIYTDKKKVAYFWGYRNHVINDAISELPVSEITKPNNIGDSTIFIPHFSEFKQSFQPNIKAVIGDSAYDSFKNIEFTAKQLNAKPIIAKNPRAGNKHQFEISSTGEPICIAGFTMFSHGKFFDKSKNRWRHKFICRIKGSKKFAQKQPFCPWNHPNFFKNRYGCCVNLRIDADTSIRQSIDYNSPSFKKLYKLRTSSERVFSRLLFFFIQHPTITGLQANANLCTIAHITILLVALTAVKTGHKDKVRFVKNFIQML